ncbi:MAG: group 1 truncated hemoglobin [Myxococcales bacterium]|nr:group 1 truncated hemoglobin [Myxococcales bacterium]MCB9709527.1 group 1 truncated hemoglobin [Myxococcales bacterium]
MTMFERIGGEEVLRAIIEDFVDAMFADSMIGFFFRAASKARIKRFEFQHAARWLGAEIAYQGRALSQAHQQHPIQLGHFNRRRTLLGQVLSAHNVPPDIVTAWLAHTDSLRFEILKDRSPSSTGDGA